MKKVYLLSTVAAAVLCAAPVKANNWDFQPYIGLDYIYSDAKVRGLAGSNEYSDEFNNGAVNAGLKFNDYFGLEAFYQRSDKQNNSQLWGKTQAKFDAVGLDLVGYVPLDCDNKFNLYGTLGAGYYDFDGKVKTYDPLLYVSENSKGWGYRAGLGLEYDVTEHFALRAGARFVWTDDVDAVNNMWEYTGGVKFKF